MTLRRSLLPAAPALLCAFALRLHQIGKQSLWFDEGWSAWAAIQPTLAQALLADSTNPPLYYLLLNLSARFLGDSEFALRMPSLWLVLLLIALTSQLALRSAGRRAAWLALWLATVSAPLWWAAQEARMYALLALLTLAALLAWQRLLRRPDRLSWLLLIACETLILYTHNSGPVFFLWLNLATTLHWLSRRGSRRPDCRRWLLAQLVVTALWLPWLTSHFVDVAAANSALADGPRFGLTLLSRTWASLWLAPWELVLRTPLSGMAIMATLPLLLLLPWRRPATRWLALHVLLLAGLLTLGLAVIGNPMHARYLVPLVPLNCALLATSVGAGRGAGRLLALTAGGLLALNLVLAADPALQHDDARGMALYYQQTLGEEDAVLAWSYTERYELAYYWRKLDVPAPLLTLPEGAGMDEVAHLLPQGGRVALNQWYTQRADYRGMAPCLLAHGGRRPPLAHSVHGMRNLLFDEAPAASPQWQEPPGGFSVDGADRATLGATGTLPPLRADQALCLPLTLVAGPELRTELQAAVIVRNRLGQIVGQTSAIFATDDQRSGRQSRPGDALSAWPVLRLPYGAMPGEYEIWLRVFDDASAGDGHEWRDPNGTPLGRELPLGIWRVVPGADWESTGRDTHLPQVEEQVVSDDLRLLAHNLGGETLHPGQTFDIHLLWQADEGLPELTLTAAEGNWSHELAPLPGPRDRITLDWRQVTLPAEMEAGEIVLQVRGGTELARWPVEPLPMLLETPDFAVVVDQPLGDAATLSGFTLTPTAPRLADRPEVTLVWRAGAGGMTASYTVFVQLLDAQGRLIAQSDSLPADGTRPTSGWREGEYIVDRHRLRFNDAARPGPARLIVGMYEARSGTRLAQWPGGADHLTLPLEVTVR